MSSYCEIQGLRQLIADRTVRRADLPPFVDQREVNGTPIILDFTLEPNNSTPNVLQGQSTSQFLDRIFAYGTLRDVTVDRAEMQRCIAQTTDADIERTQGGPGFLSTDDTGSGD